MDARTRNAWMPRYLADEVVLGVVVAAAVHLLPIAAILYKAAHPTTEVEEPLVARPAVAATLLKLGKPIDPRKLPDRLVPRARTAPKEEIKASQEQPEKHQEKPDAGPPPKDVEDSDLQNLIAKSEVFAEKPKQARPEEGREEGVKEGTETDPNKVKAGDMYAAKLGAFFRERIQYPSVLSQGEINKLCAMFTISIGPRMTLWNVKDTPVRPSGNDLFDDAARSMLQKLVEDKTALPTPPDEVIDQYRGHTLTLTLQPLGDVSKCR
jgi:hypothetical protein